ncbi:MAG: hypothetical protein ACFFD2_11235 [Promethearchaeota archaeon]
MPQDRPYPARSHQRDRLAGQGEWGARRFRRLNGHPAIAGTSEESVASPLEEIEEDTTAVKPVELSPVPNFFRV